MVDEENCVFFLPHRPRSEICELPFFLFMKGTGTGTVILQFSVKLSIFFERCFFEFLAAFYISVQLHFYLLWTGWSGAGADHYEPLIAHHSSLLSNEKVALVLWVSPAVLWLRTSFIFFPTYIVWYKMMLAWLMTLLRIRRIHTFFVFSFGWDLELIFWL